MMLHATCVTNIPITVFSLIIHSTKWKIYGALANYVKVRKPEEMALRSCYKHVKQRKPAYISALKEK